MKGRPLIATLLLIPLLLTPAARVSADGDEDKQTQVTADPRCNSSDFTTVQSTLSNMTPKKTRLTIPEPSDRGKTGKDAVCFGDRGKNVWDYLNYGPAMVSKDNGLAQVMAPVIADRALFDKDGTSQLSDQLAALDKYVKEYKAMDEFILNKVDPAAKAFDDAYAKIIKDGKPIKASSDDDKKALVAALNQTIVKEGTRLKLAAGADDQTKVPDNKTAVQGGPLYDAFMQTLKDLIQTVPIVTRQATSRKDEFTSDKVEGGNAKFNVYHMDLLYKPGKVATVCAAKPTTIMCFLDPDAGQHLAVLFNKVRRELNDIDEAVLTTAPTDPNNTKVTCSPDIEHFAPGKNSVVSQKHKDCHGGTVAGLLASLGGQPGVPGVTNTNPTTVNAGDEASKLQALGKNLGDLSSQRLNAVYDANSKADPNWAASAEGQTMKAAIDARKANPALTQVTVSKNAAGGYDYTYYSLDGKTQMTQHIDKLPDQGDQAGTQGLADNVAGSILQGQFGVARAQALLGAATGQGPNPPTDMPPGMSMGSMLGPTAATGLQSENPACGSKKTTMGDFQNEVTRDARGKAAAGTASRQEAEAAYDKATQDADAAYAKCMTNPKTGADETKDPRGQAFITQWDNDNQCSVKRKAAMDKAQADLQAAAAKEEASQKAYGTAQTAAGPRAQKALRLSVIKHVEELRDDLPKNLAKAEQYAGPDWNGFIKGNPQGQGDVVAYFAAYWPPSGFNKNIQQDDPSKPASFVSGVNDQPTNAIYQQNLTQCANPSLVRIGGDAYDDVGQNCVGPLLANYLNCKYKNICPGQPAPASPTPTAAAPSGTSGKNLALCKAYGIPANKCTPDAISQHQGGFPQ